VPPAGYEPSALGGSAGGGSAAPGTSTAAACTPLSGSDLPPGSSSVSGNVTAPNLAATLCAGGAYARVLSAGAAYDTSPYLFELNSVAASGALADFAFQSPSGASTADFVFMTGLPSLTTGTYTGGAAPACGAAVFQYTLPVPPGADCSGGTDTECPASCSRVCPAFGCAGIACEPVPPTVAYQASGATDCEGNATSTSGSWTLTLSELSAADADPSTYDQPFTPHGSLTMTLPAGAGGSGAAVFSATF